MKYILILYFLWFSNDIFAQTQPKLYQIDSLKRVKPKLIEPNIDSCSNLVTYSGIIEQEQSGSDSLFVRAIDFCCKMNGDIVEQKKNFKVVSSIYLPAYYYDLNNIKRDAGSIHFIFTVRIKEERYQYIISTLSIENKSSTNIPFEFVLSIKDVLINANSDINQLIRDFKLKMKDPLLADEETW